MCAGRSSIRLRAQSCGGARPRRTPSAMGRCRSRSTAYPRVRDSAIASGVRGTRRSLDGRAPCPKTHRACASVWCRARSSATATSTHTAGSRPWIATWCCTSATTSTRPPAARSAIRWAGGRPSPDASTSLTGRPRRWPTTGSATASTVPIPICSSSMRRSRWSRSGTTTTSPTTRSATETRPDSAVTCGRHVSAPASERGPSTTQPGQWPRRPPTGPRSGAACRPVRCWTCACSTPGYSETSRSPTAPPSPHRRTTTRIEPCSDPSSSRGCATPSAGATQRGGSSGRVW